MEFGFTEAALERRFAAGASVVVRQVDAAGVSEVKELLGQYVEKLRASFQDKEADAVRQLAEEAEQRFVMIMPESIIPKTSE